MSPVSVGKFRIVLIDYAKYEIYVLADSKAQALDKARAHYVTDGLAAFQMADRQTEWAVQEVQP